MRCWVSSICPPLSQTCLCPSLDPRWLTLSLAHEPPIGCGQWEALQDIKGGTVCPARQSLSMYSLSSPFSPNPTATSVSSSCIKVVALIPVNMMENYHSAPKGDSDVILQRKENRRSVVPKSSIVLHILPTLGNRLSHRFGFFFPLAVRLFKAWPLSHSASGHLGDDCSTKSSSSS